MSRIFRVFAVSAILCQPVCMFGRKHNAVISIEPVLVIGSDSSDVLLQWNGLCVDSLGNLYVTDRLDCGLKKFDSSGVLIARTGARGKGPGEFMVPNQVACTDSRVYVTDQENPGISVFDEHLHFIRRIQDEKPVDRVVLDRSSICLSRVLTERQSSIERLDTLGLKLRPIPCPFLLKSGEIETLCFCPGGEGVLYVGTRFSGIVYKLDCSGRIVWTRAPFGEIRKETKPFGGFMLPRSLAIKDVALDTLGNLFVLGGSSEHTGQEILVLDSEGGTLAGVTLPEKTHCIVIDRKNRLYARGDLGMSLRKYRLIYPKSILR